MKLKNKLAFLGALSMATVALAGYTSKSVLQTGNGSNGNTYTLLTDGGDALAPLTGTFGAALQNCAQVTLQAGSGNIIQNTSGQSYIRCNEYAPCASNTALLCYRRCPQYDITVDGGAVATSTNPQGNSATYYLGALPVQQFSGGGWAWSCENCQQSTTLDAGMNVLYELTTGGSAGCAQP